MSKPSGLSQSLPSSLGGAWLAELWLMLLLGALLVCLAITNHSLAWQGEQGQSKRRGEWEDGLWGPHPAGGGFCFTLADAPVWFPALAQMQKLVASKLGHAVGINHVNLSVQGWGEPLFRLVG